MYLNQIAKQKIFLIGSLWTAVEKLEEMSRKPESLPESLAKMMTEILPEIQTAAGALDRAFHRCLADCDEKQRHQLAQAAKSNTVTILPKEDPRAKQNVGVFDWEDVMTVLKHAMTGDGCLYCEKDRTEMKYCDLRGALLRFGAEEMKTGVGYGACGFGKMDGGREKDG